MWEYIEERVIQCAEYIVATGATVRACSAHFSISKSTVHKDVSERLRYIDEDLYLFARRDVSPLDSLDFLLYELLFLKEPFISFIADKSYSSAYLGKSKVCVILAQEESVLAARGHHSVRLRRTLSDEIVDERADV